MKNFTTYKKSKIGEIKIECKIEFAIGGNPRTSIKVSADGLIHNYPLGSSIRDNTLYLSGAYYGETNIKGLQDLPSDLLEWWEEATLFIEEFKKERKCKEIEEAKKEETVIFGLNSSFGFHSSNVYAKELLLKVPKEARNLITDNAKMLDMDMGDYTIDYEYSMNLKELEKLTKKAIATHEELKKEKLRAAAKEELEKVKRGENIGYKNLHQIDGDLVTGQFYYGLNKALNKEDWTRVKHLFNFIDTTVRSDEFDSMFGSNFKGYATTKPCEVCNILYPNWEKELKEKRIKELEHIISSGEVIDAK